jgi:hypothetical protein
MPLLDIDWRNGQCHSLWFLFSWSASVVGVLNRQSQTIRRRFVAETDCRVRVKTVGEIARFNHGPPVSALDGRETDQKPPAFIPPAPTLTAPARFTDRLGVLVVDSDDRRVAAVVLFVGEDHKADSDGALAFAVRAAGFMSAGAGVVIVDVLPGPANWATHLHSLTGVYPAARRTRGKEATVLAVHPEVRDGVERFAVWHHAVAIGARLPTVPVPVRGATHLELDLESSYTEACQNSRIP